MLCCRQGEDAAPPRVMVFASSQEAAAAAAQPLRNVLWGQHNISVLLPEGEEPIKVGRGSRLRGNCGVKQDRACCLASVNKGAKEIVLLYMGPLALVPGDQNARHLHWSTHLCPRPG